MKNDIYFKDSDGTHFYKKLKGTKFIHIVVFDKDEILNADAPMLKYAVQITVADVRDGGCSSSTLSEASSWGKVDTVFEQMVYAEATSVLPLIASYAYHNSAWKKRKERSADEMFAGIVAHMKEFYAEKPSTYKADVKMEKPSWI